MMRTRLPLAPLQVAHDSFMPTLSPQLIAFTIVGVLAVVGLTVYFFRHRSMYAGYEPLEVDARGIVGALRGEMFRDGDDLVMTGNFANLPTIVRFSNADNTPGLQVRMQAPATFAMTVAPSAAPPTGGKRMPLQGADPTFDSRFVVRSDQPMEARLFLTPGVLGNLKKLCCSSGTFVNTSQGALELTETVIPPTSTRHHVVEHLKQMAALVESLRSMPGSDTVKVAAFKRERHITVRIAIAVGVIAAAIVVFTATTTRPVPTTEVVVPDGMIPNEATLISDVNSWRMATPADFDPSLVNWMRNNRLEPAGRVAADFSGSGLGTDVAYLLVKDDGTRRLVILCGGVVRYDAQFSPLAGIAPLRHNDISAINWTHNQPPPEVDGDGLLLVRTAADGASGFSVFLRHNTPIFTSTAKWDSINLP